MAEFADLIEMKTDGFTLVDILNYRSHHQANQTAYLFLQDGETETSQLTYRQLDRLARAIASKLQNLDLVGSRALLLYPPGLEFIAAFFGCLYAGVVAVPAYPPRRNQNLSRLQTIVTDAQATIALTTASLLDGIESRFTESAELASLQWLATDRLSLEESSDWHPSGITPNTLAFLQYTSGSTGTPKGVMVNHTNLMHNSKLIQQCFGDTTQSSGVTWLPPYHDMGLIGGILQPLYVGAPMVVIPPVMFLQKPFRWLQAISRFRATTSGGPNFAYDLCARKITPEQLETLDLSNWEVAFTGAEPVRAETLELFAKTFEPCGFRPDAFLPCYGMAETTLIVSGGSRTSAPIIQHIDGVALEKHQVVSLSKPQEGMRTTVGCGQSLSDLCVLIVDPESRIPCTADRVGEIWVSGSSVAQGYWNQPERTQQEFQAYTSTGEGPFLRTGDLGFMQNGELFITGRIKDILIIRGQNHYPQDIEHTVENSHPALRLGCGAAFAVEVGGKERLVVVQEVERNYLRKVNITEIVGNISQAVAAEHSLQVYATVLIKTGSIPKTSSGKIQRHLCRSRFLAGTLEVVEDWSETPQGKTKFLHLQAEVESLLQELSVHQ